MSSKPDDFEEQLEIGTAGEDKILPWLERNNTFVQDMRYQRHGEKKGPRLKGLGGSLILPDFAVYNQFADKGNFAVDVKVKSAIYPIKGKMCFTVDDYKFDDYLRCVEIMKLDYLQLIFVYNDLFHVYKHDEVLPGKHYFGNAKGDYAYLFEYSNKKVRY